jgi:hypothetical protein
MKYIIDLFFAILLFVSGLIIGGKNFSTHEIQVVKEIEYKTVYKYEQLKPENVTFTLKDFNLCIDCVNSPIDFSYMQRDNILTVKAFDACKENERGFEIKTPAPVKMYLTIGIIGILSGFAIYHYFH